MELNFDPLLLSRLQFAGTVMFHYLFPPLTIGMGVILVYLDGMNVRTGDPLYARAARFWTNIFALNFAMGVATGIVMEFEFGTNWARYSRFVGDVFGSALAAEGLFAFFLESGFLAVLVFGWDRVSPRMHFFATCMVALGSIFSSIWIVVANSWMQTPAGHEIVPMMRDGVPFMVDGVPAMRAEIVDFWAMVFNPSSVHRLVHVWIGCFIAGSFFVLSISAWYLLHDRHREFAERSFKGALVLATAASLAALASGHLQARSVYRHQPAKLAALEAHFETGVGDLTLFGWPDLEERTVRFQVAIPGGLSFLLFDDFSRQVDGLDRFRPEDQPVTVLPFVGFHLMVGLGMGLIALTLTASFLWWRGSLFEQRWLLWIFVFAILAAVVANQAGWVAAETGRQPWIVHPPTPRDAAGELVLGPAGVVEYDEAAGLRTAVAHSPHVSGEQVFFSIVMFGAIYILLFSVWIFVLNQKIQKGPEEGPIRPRRRPHASSEHEVIEDLLDVVAARPGHDDSLTGPRRPAGGDA